VNAYTRNDRPKTAITKNGTRVAKGVKERIKRKYRNGNLSGGIGTDRIVKTTTRAKLSFHMYIFTTPEVVTVVNKCWGVALRVVLEHSTATVRPGN